MKTIVIGAGASGLMAAGWAAKNGEDVTIFEKTSSCGKKILISGKGRCNITNAIDIGDFIEKVPGNGNFLYSAFYSFTNEDVVKFFNDLGVATKVERGGRVFPLSDTSKDVLNALLRFIDKYNVKIEYNSKVEDIVVENSKVIGVKVDGRLIKSDRVILATGGKSYSKTGSTGDGYNFAKKLGHTIVAPRPSLVGIITKEEWVPELQGLSLKNVAVTFKHKNKKIYEDFGEMLFTHFGISGPVILSGSRAVHSFMNNECEIDDVTVEIDLKPALDIEKLDDRIIRDFEKYINKQLKNALFDLLPEKLIPVVIKLSEIDEDKKVNVITKQERRKICEILKHLTVTLKKLRPIEEAIVTAGGININEINPSTMESKIIKNLYFSGEVIDVDAYTGGFNLQIAFSTGYLAGISGNN